MSTIVTAVVAGVLLMLLARRTGAPTIVVLLVGGVLLGPQVLGVRSPLQPDALGAGLQTAVSLAVGLILFEGGLTLDLEDFRRAPRVIRRLLTAGVLVTWFGTTAALRWVAGLGWAEAVTTASLVIVTGPTVVLPLLKRLRVDERVASILRWEAVLIDPIGVFVAVLCFEWLIEGAGPEALLFLGLRVVAGVVIGLAGGGLIALALRTRSVPEDLLNVTVLAGALLTFGVAEAIRSEAGLLSVTVAGFVVGLSGSAELERVRAFKEELTSLLIALVFMLLAARLDLEQVRSFGWSGAAATACVIFLVRPLSVGLCTLGQPLGLREKALLSWIAPRGVVAASMASLIAIHLEARGGSAQASFVETFVWSVIVGTILLQGLTAGPLVRALGLQRAEPQGWAIVGAHALSRALAPFLRRDAAHPVLLVDSNARAVREAREAGLEALEVDARDPALAEHPSLAGVGRLLALTDNEDLNERICAVWAPRLGADKVFRWASGAAPLADDHGAGHGLAWGSKPSQLAFDITRGEASLALVPAQGGPQGALPLLSLSPEQGFGPPGGGGPRALALLPRRARLRAAFSGERVFTSAAADPDALRAELLARLAALDAEAARLELPSFVERGVALMHSHARGIEAPRLDVARLAERLELASPPEPAVGVVFLLISPVGDAQAHLLVLSELAGLLASDEHRAAFLAAPDPASLAVAIDRALRG
ncbi:MAG: cation:proton antiporter [Planctomycetota bacterium]